MMSMFQAFILGLPWICLIVILAVLLITLFIRNIETRKKIIMVSFIFTVIIIISNFVFLYNYLKTERDLKSREKSVFGVVISVNYETSIIKYCFRLNNQDYFKSVKIDFTCQYNYEQGNKIEIFYRSENPNINYPAQKHQEKQLDSILLIIISGTGMAINCIIGIILGVYLMKLNIKTL